MDWWWDLLKAMDAHEGQAAWAQGVFSVAAVAAAVWIDQGAARRLRRDRLAAQRDARDARVQTVESVAVALEVFAQGLEDVPLEERQHIIISETMRRPLNVAADVVAYYLGQNTAEIDADLVGRLANAHRRLAAVIEGLTASDSAFLRLSYAERPKKVQSLRAHAESIRAGT